MLLKIEKRAEYSRSMIYLTPVIALILTMLTSILLFYLLGVSPVEALYNFFILPINSEYGFSELFVKGTPLILIAIGIRRHWFHRRNCRLTGRRAHQNNHCGSRSSGE